MINIKDKKETKEKVDEIIKRRTKCIENEKNSQKKANIRKKTNKKHTAFKKILLILFLWILEILICGVIVVTNWCLKTTERYTQLFDVVNEQNQIIQELTIEIKSEPQAIKTIEDNKIYLGKFKITHYCACTKCCGKNAQGITASGKRVEENKTIAVDPKVIKLGSQVYIDGYGYMEAQDTGSAIKGNIIDVYVADHQEALNLGVKYKDVYLVK